MHRHLPVLIAAALLLGGCAALDGPRGFSLTTTGVDEQVALLDRLATAEPDELAAMGERLRAAAAGEDGRGTPMDSLRYAFWKATPGHPGHAPAQARERLERLLNEGRPPRDLQALIRVELSHLRLRAELAEDNRRLTAENQRLQEQIQALTTLERRMGGSDDGDSDQRGDGGNGDDAEP